MSDQSPPTPMRVLVVDDDPAITQIYADVLGREGYQVLAAGSCLQAMEQLDAVKGDAHVLVVDFGLPDCDGADLVRDAAAKYGPRPTMYVSGWTDEFWQFPDTPARWIVLRKPVSIKKLLAGVKWLAHGGEKPAELDEDA